MKEFHNSTEGSNKEKAYMIAEKLESQLESLSFPFGLVLLGSSVYGDREKRAKTEDSDFIVVLDEWDSLNKLYDNPDILPNSGLDIPHLFPEDRYLLSQNPGLLVRMSGQSRDFQLKTTLNFTTIDKLARLPQPFPHNTRKIAHGKSVPLKLNRSLMGNDIFLERVTRDTSNLYDDNYGINHCLQGDKNFYITKNGDVVLGILTDSLLTGNIIRDFDNANVGETQIKLRKQVIRAIYYRMVLEANDNGQDINSIKEMFTSGSIDFTIGLMKWNKFSPEYKQKLQQVSST